MGDPPKRPAAARHALRSAALAVLALGLVALVYQRPYTYRIDVGAPDDAPYVDGFEARERRDDYDWRWSAGRSQLVFHNAGQLVRSPRLVLRLTSLQPPGYAVPQVSLALGERVLATFDAPRTPAVMEFPIDAGGLGSGDWTLTLASQAVERRDGRRLAVLVDWAELASGSDASLPPWRTAALLALGAVSLYLLLAQRGFGALAWPAGLAFALLGGGALQWAREASVELLPYAAGALMVACSLSLAVASGWPARLARLAAARAPASFAIGVVFSLAGQIVLSAGGNRTAGLALLVLGVALLVTLGGAGADERAAPGRGEWIGLGGLALLALLMRVYRLGEVPFAIFRDEARHGTLALDILATHTLPPLFLGPPINQPAPYFLALAAMFRLIEPGLVSLRLVSAVAGAAAVPLAWRLVRELAGPRVAIVTAFVLAISSWHVSVSRFAVNYVLPTLFTLPAYLFLLKGFRSGRAWHFALGGLLAGAAQYASHTAKSALVVLGAMVVDEAIVRWRAGRWAALRGFLGHAAIAGGVGLLVVMPVLREIQRAPDAYTARMQQVSIWNAEDEYNRLTGLARNLGATLGAFNVEGDPNGRHHLPGLPLLDPVSAVCFAVGLILVARRLRESRYRFLLYWLGAGTLPGLLTVDAPSATRTVEAAAPACMVAALGALALFERARSLFRARAPVRAALIALAAAALLCNAWVYFGAMYRSPAVWGKFAPVGTQLGKRLQVLENKGAIGAGAALYAPDAFVRHPDELHVLRFFMPRLEVRSFQDGGTPPRAGDLVAIPNYRDFWLHVATVTPRQATRAEEAAADLAAWRKLLATAPLSAVEEGPPFPATHDPTYWLSVVREQ